MHFATSGTAPCSPAGLSARRHRPERRMRAPAVAWLTPRTMKTDASFDIRTRMACGRAALGDLSIGREREWLVTNGAGAFAAGTLSGMVTRRYHGLLVAALRPPVARTVTLVKIDATVHYLDRLFELGTNEYADGTVHPHGYRLLESFRLEGTIPTWTWALADALLECRVYMARGRNTTYVSYRLSRASAPMRIELRPLTAWCDYHWHQRGGPHP